MEQKPYRPFQISCGLREGYDVTGRTHDIADARVLIQQWMEERLRTGKKIAAGMLQEGQFIYPWNGEEGVSSHHEPAFYYKGMIREDASDEEAKEMLTELAQECAKKLGQKRVHVEFCSTYFVVENN